MNQKQKNTLAFVGEKRAVFFISIPEFGGEEIPPEEALRNLRKNVDTVDKKTIIKSLETLENIPDLPPQIQQGLRDSAKNIDNMSAVDRAKFRQALERVQPFLVAAESVHQEHKQAVISVLEKYNALLPDEEVAIEKWKKGDILSDKDVQVRDSAIHRMVGVNAEGWAEREVQKPNLSEKDRLELWLAIKSGMYTLGMGGDAIESKMREKAPLQTEEQRKNRESIENISSGKQEFKFLNDDIREETNRYKQELLVAATQGNWKQVGDARLMPILAVLLHDKGASIPEKVRGQAIQTINHVTTSGEHQFSKRMLDEKAGKWNQGFSRMKEGKKGSQLGSIERKPSEYVYLEHMAIYELAIQAQEKMNGLGIFEHEVGDNIGGIKITEGNGFSLEKDLSKYSAKDFEEAGSMAKRMLSPAGMATFYVMQYGGLLMALMNFILFVQNPKENQQALAYTAAGFAAMKWGSEMTRRNTIDSLLNPENKLFNQVAYLSTRHRVDILNEYAENMDFYMQLNLGERDKLKAIFSNYRRTQKETFNKEKRDPAKKKKKKGNKVDIPKYQESAPIKDFLDGGPLAEMLLDGADESVLKKMTEDDTPGRQQVRYDAIKFLLDRKIGHGELSSVQEIAEKLPRQDSVAARGLGVSQSN